MAEYQSYLLFAMLDRHITYPSKSVAREKQILKKECYHCHIAWDDGFLLDYNKAGLFVGPQAFPIDYPFFLPIVQEEESMQYRVIKSKVFTDVERDVFLSKVKRFYDYTGETDLDQVATLRKTEVPELFHLTRLTHSTLIAYLFDAPDYWLWDTDRIYHRYGELGIPGTLVDFDYHPPVRTPTPSP